MLLSHLDWLKNCHAFMLSHIKLAPTANIIYGKSYVIHLSVYLGFKPGLNKINVKEIDINWHKFVPLLFFKSDTFV